MMPWMSESISRPRLMAASERDRLEKQCSRAFLLRKLGKYVVNEILFIFSFNLVTNLFGTLKILDLLE
jgi:hypothetical protein